MKKIFYLIITILFLSCESAYEKAEKAYQETFPKELENFISSGELEKVPDALAKLTRLINAAANDTLFESDTLADKIKIDLGENYVMASSVDNGSSRTTMVLNSEALEGEDNYASLGSSSNEDFIESLKILADQSSDPNDLEKWGYDFTNKTENLKILKYRLKELANMKYLIVQRDLLKIDPEVSKEEDTDYEGGFLIGQTYVFDYQTEELINSFSFSAQSSETITYTDYGSYTDIGSKIKSDFESNIRTATRDLLKRYFEVDGSLPY